MYTGTQQYIIVYLMSKTQCYLVRKNSNDGSLAFIVIVMSA